MPHVPLTAAALACGLTLSCSSGSGSGAGSRATGGADQSSPEALTRAAYRNIHAGNFEALCRLILPDQLPRFAASGSDCQTYMADHYTPEERSQLGGVMVDASKIQRNGDTAVVPESAVTFSGRPSSDDDTKVVRSNGKWWIGG
jgi:hypothetical protein